METFTLSLQAVSNVHKWFRISSGLKIMSTNVFIITFPMASLYARY